MLEFAACPFREGSGIFRSTPMGYNDVLNRGARRVVLTQALLTLLVAGGFGVVGGTDELLAAVYGGMVTIIITAWLAWRLRTAGSPVDAGFGAIFLSWMLRYVAVALLLGAGLGYLKLVPLPLLSAFAVTQFGFLMAVRTPKV